MSLKMLSNAYFLANIRFDTAENEPAKNLQNFGKPPDAAGEGAPVQVCSIVRQEQARKQTPGRTSNGPQDGRDGSHTDDAKEQLDTQASAQRTAYLCKKKDNKLSNWMQNIFAILYIFRQAMLTPRKVH